MEVGSKFCLLQAAEAEIGDPFCRDQSNASGTKTVGICLDQPNLPTHPRARFNYRVPLYFAHTVAGVSPIPR